MSAPALPEPGGRVAVGVSGAGSNLRALHSAEERGELGGAIVLVFADRPCPALAWAAEQGIDTALVPGGDDAALAETLAGARPTVIVLAGYLRLVGPAVLAAYPGRVLNTHPSLLPAFPGAHAVRDALEHGVAITGCTVHLVDETLDGGPILAQEPVPVVADDSEASLHARIRSTEHRLLPRVVALLLADCVRVTGRIARLDPGSMDDVGFGRRALLSVSDKTGLAPFARRLVRAGFELVSTGGTARALREAGLPVTDVAAVTGFPEMFDGRIKTLHPRIHAGVLADQSSRTHRRALVEAGIAPFELVVVNLYPFAAAADRPGVTVPELIEEIDIGGPALIRAAAKNHRGGVAVVTSPARYESVIAAIEPPGRVGPALAAALAVEAFRHTAAYDARIASELPRRLGEEVDLPDEPGLPGATDPYPSTLT
ncbi:MAG: phosphoribosylglycinamide formyltransferase, partial [Chloroflexi bacterium]|nr:phosphoribosylglycinamide formyltransferase [Chloroflexota bacterium]